MHWDVFILSLSHYEWESCIDYFRLKQKKRIYANLIVRDKLKEPAPGNEEAIIWSQRMLGTDWPD